MNRDPTNDESRENDISIQNVTVPVVLMLNTVSILGTEYIYPTSRIPVNLGLVPFHIGGMKHRTSDDGCQGRRYLTSHCLGIRYVDPALRIRHRGTGPLYPGKL